jgi:transposase-like protein
MKAWLKRKFKDSAGWSYWSVHVEAWRRSGISCAEYCRRHQLSKGAFDRWRKALCEMEEERQRARERRKRTREPLSRNNRTKAAQAFWAMHVEALNWSGLTAKEYASAHRISLYGLRTWRARFDADPLQIDWRARVHSSVRPTVSASASDSAKDAQARSVLTTAPPTDPAASGRRHRRSFSDEEKRTIVLETERPGATVSQVARAHGIVTSVLFRWRAELGLGKGRPAKLVEVRVADGQSDGDGARSTPLVLQNLLQVPDGMETVDLADGRRVFAPIGSDPDAVRRHVAEREQGR